MAKQPESKLQKKIRSHLEKEVGGFWFKMWGGPFTMAGLPDLIGCVDGLFIGLEVKLPKTSSQPSKIQLVVQKRIRKAGGVSEIVRSEGEAVDVVNKALERAARRFRLRKRLK